MGRFIRCFFFFSGIEKATLDKLLQPTGKVMPIVV